MSGVDRVDVITELERLIAAAGGAQMAQVVGFVADQEAAQRVAGVPRSEVGRGVAEQVALARRCSPWQARVFIGHTRALDRDLPGVRELLADGAIDEATACSVVVETSHLSAADRREVDARIAPRLAGLGHHRSRMLARHAAIEADPAAAVARASQARSARHVSLSPAPDTMTRLTALLPVEQGVAAYASLLQAATAAAAGRDERGKGQVMADTLVERLTGANTDTPIPVEIGLVMADQTLLDGADTPAQIPGYGPIPARIARDLVDLGVSGRDLRTTKIWLRRLFTDPVSGVLTDLDHRRRRFTGVLAAFVRYRDQTCRDAYCDAPIAHLDYITPYRLRQHTSARFGQGLCQSGNLAKEAPGWSTPGTADRRVTVTPTGHRYLSRPPPVMPLPIRRLPLRR